MKLTYKVLVSAAVAVICMSGCKGDFLDTKPTSSIGTEQVIQDFFGLESLIEGMHNRTYTYYTRNQTIPVGVFGAFVAMDIMADDMFNSTPAYHMGLHRWDDHRDPRGEYPLYFWDFFYSQIMDANVIIAQEERFKDAKAVEQYHQIMGEAYTFRVWSYFNLVQCFGKRYEKDGANSTLGVVLRLDENKEPKARATVAEVYKQIDEDLKAALEHMKKAGEATRKNRLSYPVLCGIASRIALVKEDYVAAENYAQVAIKNTSAELDGEELLKGFNNYGSKEWMWGYYYGAVQNYYFADFNSNFSYNFNGHNRATKFAINREIYDALGVNDIRRKLFICEDLGGKLPADVSPAMIKDAELSGFPVKFKANSVSDSRGSKVVMRLAEMYYNLAEALARQGKNDAAQKALFDVVTTRDAEYVKSVATGADLIKEIFVHKRVDLWLEGHRFFDLKRTKQLVTNPTANLKYLDETRKAKALQRGAMRKLPKSVDDKSWEFAIPYREIVGAEGLVEQNPF